MPHHSAQHLLGDVHSFGWIKEKTGQALKTFIKKYIDVKFQRGTQVEYCKLNDNGTFGELVKATIVKLHYDLGSYMICFDDNIERDTLAMVAALLLGRECSKYAGRGDRF